jgi:hypothetical protein
MPSLMRPKPSIAQIIIIIVAAVGSVFVAHYEDFLPYSWQTYTAPDGTFSIELPSKPTVETSQKPVEGGGNITFHLINAATNGGRAYSCSYVDVENANPKPPDQVLESARDGSLGKVQGTLVSQNQLTIQGFPGLQFQARVRGNSLMDSRYLLVGKRLYMMMAVATDGRKSDPKAVQRMFDSFKLNPK